jgi:hypothetical protein
MERINSSFLVLKRKACGYQTVEYFLPSATFSLENSPYRSTGVLKPASNCET